MINPVRAIWFLAAIVCSLAPLPALAHDSRPLAIVVSEIEPGVAEVNWIIPPSLDRTFWPDVFLSGQCEPNHLHQNERSSIHSRYFVCPNDLSQAVLEIHYPKFNPSLSAVVTVKFTNGEIQSSVLNPTQTTLHIEHRYSPWEKIQRYFSMGFHHILSGYDHLLFVLCLTLVARTPKRIIIALSGFTLSHSVSLFLVATGRLHLSIPAIEAVIVLSIVFLAAEIARGRRKTLAWERPTLVALIFGLAHGAGFGSALLDLGLPQTHAIFALLFFNLGVEVGQLAIVTAGLLAFWIAGRYSPALTTVVQTGRLRKGISYGIGVTATLWFYQAILAFSPNPI